MLRKLEKYELLEEIGHGGMATVFRARDTRLERLVAVKVLHPHLRAAEEARSRFTREAQSIARLKHPHILDIYDYSGEDSEESYIASELLSGPTLKHFAEKQRSIPPEIAACFCIPIAEALAAAHAEGIVHRDVKPENVLLHENRTVKLTDFGIAQMVDSQSFTATGQILGSPGHMAPEQVEGEDCDERTDIFSLGTVLYYLATSRLPFTGRNPHHVLKRIMDGEYPDPLRVAPSIGNELCRIIVKCLAHEPDGRYASAAELIADLRAFVAAIGIDEPDQALAAYLSDPEGTSGDIRERVVTHLTVRGERRAEEGDVPGALDDWNRVLAVDESNARVLSLIERVGRRHDRRRRLLVGTGLGLGVLGLVLGALGLSLARPADGPPAPDPVGETTESQGNVADAAVLAVAPIRPEDTGPVRRARPVVRKSLPTATRARAHLNQPRQVIFRPTPQNVAIGVDGAEPRSFGPSFYKVELEPGPHRFKVVGGARCCVDQEKTITIPPGTRPFVWKPSLDFRSAGLYVKANVPATVRVDGGRARGRAREIIHVPMSQLEDVVRITVTAPDHSDYTGEERLRAGDVKEVAVTLTASESTP